jgi:DNA-directed RNA polymerase subunit omega
MAQGRLNLMDPPIEDLLDKVDSKFTLVALGALRARQVNAYYNSLGEGLGRVVPPQVASVSGKPLSIAFEEIAASKATYTRPTPEELAAAEAGEDGATETTEVDELTKVSVAPVATDDAPGAEGTELGALSIDDGPTAAGEPAEDEGPAAG